MFWAIITAEEAHKALDLPIYTVIPFVGLLLTIGIMSFISANFPHNRVAHFWENNYNKLILAILWSIPVLFFFWQINEWRPLIHSLEEYFAFISLIFALFVISGGIYLEGNLKGTPIVNTIFLAIGGVIANFFGTAGASMILIRPLLRTNSERAITAHIPIFFIFIVSNIGGCLLPIGDPPLFLGYLRGVPFFWTLRLIVEWITAFGIILTIFYIWDSWAYKREKAYIEKMEAAAYRPLKLKGKINFLWLFGVLAAVIFLTPSRLEEWGLMHGPLKFLREYVMIGFAILSLITSPLSSETRRENNFTFEPIKEVAFLFIGIFITMVPALEILRAKGPELGITEPWQFFWATGALSSFLDNAPTYLTFFSLAQGVAEKMPGVYHIPPELAHIGIPEKLLAAVSLGAVFMGANTYIGNAPNFLVKAIADEWGFKTPDFFTYIIKYSIPILMPVFILITLLYLI
ncbi:MAG: sodium:proton antiporter [candidate division WOR-3 bacterium]